MGKLDDLSGRMLDLATQVGETVRDRVPDKAMDWVQTGAALGALKTGSRVATRFVRRNPLIAVAAAAGAGLLWYAARRRAQQARNAPIEGSAKRVEAKRAKAPQTVTRAPRKRRTPTGKPTSPRGRRTG
jgi:hypothetical protein